MVSKWVATYRYEGTPLVGEISDYKEDIRLHKVDETKWEVLWDKIVRAHQ